YYVSRDLHHSGDARCTEGWRLPAREIEPLVRAKIVGLLNEPIELLATSNIEMPCPDTLKSIVARGETAAAKVRGPGAHSAKLIREIVAEIRLGTGHVSIALNAAKLASLLEITGLNEPVKLDLPVRLKRSGNVMRLITRSGS